MIPRLRLRNRRAELVLLAAGGALLLLAGLLAVGPRAAAVARLARAASAAAAEAADLETRLAPYAQAFALQAARAPVRTLGGPTGDAAVPALLDRLAGLGAACAVKVTALSPTMSEPRALPLPATGGERAPAACRVLTIDVEAVAGFDRLGRYFEALCTLDVPLTVLSLAVSPAGGDRVAARFTLGTWVLDAAPAAATSEEEPREAA